MDYLIISDNTAILNLPKKVDHKTIYHIDLSDTPIDHLIINFQITSTITLSGLLYLICLSGYLYNNAVVRYNLTFDCQIINLREYVLKFIMNFGFLQQMISKGNLFRVNGIDLLINKELIETEDKFVQRQLGKRKSGDNSKGLIMPASTIVMGERESFESYVYNIRNQFSDYYYRLIDLDFFSITNDIDENFHGFSKTIFEIIKNIYDHSKSWGIGAIHARDDGVEIAYYDIGIGISNSMKSSEKYSSKTSLELIKQALIDGESSKNNTGNNAGRGFTVIQKFVKKRRGFLSIRTDKYHLLNKIEKEINWFPGTQIVVFIPKFVL